MLHNTTRVQTHQLRAQRDFGLRNDLRQFFAGLCPIENIHFVWQV